MAWGSISPIRPFQFDQQTPLRPFTAAAPVEAGLPVEAGVLVEGARRKTLNAGPGALSSYPTDPDHAQ